MEEVFLSIVIPAYNESHRIVKSMEEIIEYLESKIFSSEIIVVDDGSTDDTARIVEEKFRGNNVKVIRNGQNRGKGYTVRNGMLAAKGKYVLFADADNATPIKELNRLLREIEEEDIDFAYGIRLIRREGGFVKNLIRKIIGRGFLFLAHAIVLKDFIYDTQCGFKCFRRSAARKIFEKALIESGVFDVEIFFLAEKFGLRGTPVPVHWRHMPGSTINVYKCIIGDPFSMMRIKLNDMMGKYEK
jgi:dolichyl-phosphate beta-glucosyltransferase